MLIISRISTYFRQSAVWTSSISISTRWKFQATAAEKMLSLSVLLASAVLMLAAGCPYLGTRRGYAADSRQLSSSTTSSVTHNPFCKKTNGTGGILETREVCNVYAQILDKYSAITTGPQVHQDQLANILGESIRLAFHDAGEIDIHSKDAMGPDGCLSTDNENAGLVEPSSSTVSVVDPIWQQVCDKVSRADFWVLFAELSLRLADKSGSMRFPYYFGRRDNLNCEVGNGRLPDAQKGFDEVERVFVKQMGLTIEDAVTLLGAHSIGHVHVENSGFGFKVDTNGSENIANNSWVTTPTIFDNTYYIDTVYKKWTNSVPVSEGKTTWRHGKNFTVRLNAELSLVYPIVAPQNDDGAFCGPHVPTPAGGYGCTSPKQGHYTNRSHPSTYPLWLKYADRYKGREEFLAAFPLAFIKMTNAGYNYGSVSGQKLGTLAEFDLTTCGVGIIQGR